MHRRFFDQRRIGTAQEPADTPPIKLSEIRSRYRKAKADLQELSVNWDTKFEYKIPQDVAGKAGYDTEVLITEVYAASKQGKVFYDQKYTLVSGKHTHFGGLKRETTAYDGVTSQLLKEWWVPPGPTDKWIQVQKGDATRQNATDDYYMASHGLPRISAFRILDDPYHLAIDFAESLGDDAYRIEPGKQTATDGTPCIVVSGGRERIWFDPKLDFAVRQREWQHEKDSRLLRRIRFTDFVECAPGTWLAKTLHSDVYPDPADAPEDAAKPFTTRTLSVRELKVGSLPDSMFRIKLDPGDFVHDATLIDRSVDGTTPVVSYEVPPNPADLENVIKKATEERAAADKREQRRKGWSRGLWVAAGLLAVAVCLAYFGFRRSLRRAAK